jgi:hypothetical protein
VLSVAIPEDTARVTSGTHGCRSLSDGFNAQASVSALGHEGRFALASLSAGYELRKETIAGTHGNERDAPIAAIPTTAAETAGDEAASEDPGADQQGLDVVGDRGAAHCDYAGGRLFISLTRLRKRTHCRSPSRSA